MTACLTCEIIERRDSGEAPLWDCIQRTAYWDIAHCNCTALPGWLVVVARRHVAAIDELTEEEALELGVLLRRVSIALKAVTGCAKTYVVQFAEGAGHAHVHFHVVPRMADIPADRRGPDVFGYLRITPEERVPDDTMNALAADIQQHLLAF